MVKSRKNREKGLQSREACGIIIKRDCTGAVLGARYAMKREVAALAAGFSVEYVRFETGRKNLDGWNHRVFPEGRFYAGQRMLWVLTLSPGSAARIAGFSVWRVGTPGTVLKTQPAE